MGDINCGKYVINKNNKSDRSDKPIIFPKYVSIQRNKKPNAPGQGFRKHWYQNLSICENNDKFLLFLENLCEECVNCEFFINFILS